MICFDLLIPKPGPWRAYDTTDMIERTSTVINTLRNIATQTSGINGTSSVVRLTCIP